MSGKHGRHRSKRSDEAGALATAPGHRDADLDLDASTDRAAALAVGGPQLPAVPVAPTPVVYLPPTLLAPPTPPSLPPIRSTPLPGYDVTAPTADVDQPPLAAAAVEAPAAPVAAAPVAAAPVAPAPVAPVVPAAPVAPAPVAPVPAAPVAAAPVAPVPAAPVAPVVPAAPVAPVPATPASVVPALPLPTAQPEADPTLALLPLPGEPILPGDRPGARGIVHDERSRRRRLLLAAIAGAVVVVLLITWLLSGRHSSAPKAGLAAPVGRTQTTLLIQLSGDLGGAVGSALVAHDTAAHDGVVVLVPSDLIAQVPGFGSMPFGEASTVGDPTAPRSALSDLVGVTIDGSWTLTPAALAALVDRVGGVTLTVDRDVTQTVGGTTSIVVAAGQQKLGGKAAVEYASFLAPDETEQAELARLDAVLRQLVAALPTNQPELITDLAGLGSGSVTSFSLAKLAGLLTGLASDGASNALSDQLLPVTALQTGTDDEAYGLDTANTATLVKNQLAGSIPTDRLASGNRVYVQNQVGTPGLGETTRTKLQAAGFLYIQGDNTTDMPNSTAISAVVIFGDTAAQIAQGDAVARALGLPTSDVRISNTGFTVADVVVKLGVDYKP